MEGASSVTNNLRFIEAKTKFKVVEGHINSQCHKLITSANNHGFVIIASDNNTIKYISLNKILSFTASNVKAEIVNFNQFDAISQLTFKPTLLTVARYGYSSTLLVTGLNGSNHLTIEAFDLDTKTSISRIELAQFSGFDVADYAWHPNYFESLVVLCTTNGILFVLAIRKKEKRISIVYTDQTYGALTCCWSPKGKNLAIGLSNGRILRWEPSITADGFSFKEVDKSTLTFTNPKIGPEHRVIKLRWINKTFLMSCHAKYKNPNGPETVYSLITVKPMKPYLYWTNICFENQIDVNYDVHLVNLSNFIICASSASGETSVIGADCSKGTELQDWSSLIIDEEGARIELPLDANNQETLPRGVTTTFVKNLFSNDNIERPVLLYFTSGGVICSYAAMHPNNSLKLPEFQEPAELPFSVNYGSVPQQNIEQSPTTSQSTFSLSGGSGSLFGNATSIPVLKPSTFSIPPPSSFSLQGPFSTQATSDSFSSSLSAALNVSTPPAPAPTPKPALPAETAVPTSISSALSVKTLDKSLESKSFSPSQTISNPQPTSPVIQERPKAPLRIPPPDDQTGEIVQSSFAKEPALSKEDYELIIKLRQELDDVKKSIDFNEAFLSLFDNVNSLRNKFQEIQDIHKIHEEVLDVVKEDIDSLDLGMLESLYLIEYIKSRGSGRRSIDPMTAKKVETIKSKSKVIADKLKDLNNHVDVSWEEFVRRSRSKNRRLNSLDIIYKTMATNQKIINVLKKKAKEFPAVPLNQTKCVNLPTIREQDESKLRSFKEFLSCRNVVPVRRN